MNPFAVLGGVAVAAMVTAVVWLAWLQRRRGWGTWGQFGWPAAAAAGHLLAAAVVFDLGTSQPMMLGSALLGALAGGLSGSRLPQQRSIAGVLSPRSSAPILLWGATAVALQVSALTGSASASRWSLYALAFAFGVLAGLAGTLLVRARQLPAVAMTVSHCGRCGAPIHPDPASCPMCGLPLNSAEPAATAADPPTP